VSRMEIIKGMNDSEAFVELVEKSGLFDKGWHLAEYPMERQAVILDHNLIVSSMHGFIGISSRQV